MRTAAWGCLFVGVLCGCARVPIYLEPGGHSTSYRRHAERHDRLVAASLPPVEFVEHTTAVPVIVEEEVRTGQANAVVSPVPDPEDEDEWPYHD